MPNTCEPLLAHRHKSTVARKWWEAAIYFLVTAHDPYVECGIRPAAIIASVSAQPGSVPRSSNAAIAASACCHGGMAMLLDCMEQLRATPPAGIQARAYSLAQHGGHGDYSFNCETSMLGGYCLSHAG